MVAERPTAMWGTDATKASTTEEGWTTNFVAVHHGTQEVVGIHAAKVGNRFEALEPICGGLRYLDGFGPGIAAELKLRHDHGSLYLSDTFQEEVAFLGIESSPALVRSLDGNRWAERLIRTLKGYLVWVRTFRTVEELRLALHEWLRVCNERWFIQRHGYWSPAEVRREYLALQEAA